MYEKLLINYCSPTLASLKSGSLFTYFSDDAIKIKEVVRSWNLLLNKKGIFVENLYQKPTSALIYVYRPKMLLTEINATSSRNFLSKLGYNTSNLDMSISRLKERIEANDGFPHEIGLFLGYPYEDVEGFIENCGKNHLCNGLWKVYKNENIKKRRFTTLIKVKKSYEILYKNGRKIENLCV